MEFPNSKAEAEQRAAVEDLAKQEESYKVSFVSLKNLIFRK